MSLPVSDEVSFARTSREAGMPWETRMSWETWLDKWFIPLMTAAVLINLGGLLIPILEPDGALYATIAKTIAQTGDFINLRVEGKDWLDKPHLPFWLAALSFRLFGISGFAYKLPALLCWALGGWYTYRFAGSLYGRSVARLSLLLYVSAAHLVISNNDVRAEPYLTGFVIGSVYHFYKLSRLLTKRGLMKDGSAGIYAEGAGLDLVRHLVAGSLLAACSVMTKGPFVLITIAAGFLLEWALTGQWRQLLQPYWWVGAGLIALFILPELYCLYIQFDRHPEKVVFGHSGVSGIRFFFWDSQFGRFFNTGPIRGSGDPFFYFHTVLWAFLPWSLLLYAAIVYKCRQLLVQWRSRRSNGNLPAASTHEVQTASVAGDSTGTGSGDAILLGASLLTFLVFTLSRFQLPHYLNMLFPFFSILTAAYLCGDRSIAMRKVFFYIQGGIILILPVLLLIVAWFFHAGGWMPVMICVVLSAITAFRLFRGRGFMVATGRSIWMALIVYAFINFYLYPFLLHYQAGMEAGRYIEKQLKSRNIATAADMTMPQRGHPAYIGYRAYMLQETPANYSFEFYCPIPVERVPSDSLSILAAGTPGWVFLPAANVDCLRRRGYNATEQRLFPNFHVSELTGEFINYQTRPSVLDWQALISTHPQSGQ